MEHNNSTSIPSISDADRVAFLITGYIRSTLTDAEKDELDDWITSNDSNMELFAHLTDPVTLDEELKTYNSFNSRKAIAVIKSKLVEQAQPAPKRIGSRKMVWYTAAASIAFIVILLYWINKPGSNNLPPQLITKIDLDPGTDKAVLVSSDGSRFLLDSLNSAAEQVSKLGFRISNGRLVYNPSSSGGVQGVKEFYTLSIPRGAQYKLTLPDGSLVWLNAQSSIRFPSSFEKNRRDVQVSGEVFIDVVKKADHPFYVEFNRNHNGAHEKTEIKVLGTSFNVHTYPDETFSSVALLEGKIQLTSSGNTYNMREKQLAMLTKQSINVSALQNEEEVMAWKNGLFEFKDATIESIMNQVARWYNVEIEYDGKINYHFNASIERSVPASRLLYLLEQTGRVHFTIQKNKIIVKP
jgi:transmembrane sensor